MRQHAEQRIAEAEAKAAQVGKQARDDNAKVGVIHVTISVVSQCFCQAMPCWTGKISMLLLVSACFMPCMADTANWSFKIVCRPDCYCFAEAGCA